MCLKKNRNPFFVLLFLICTAVLFSLAGCENQARRKAQEIQGKKAQQKENRDSIREAFRYLPQLVRLDRTTALKEIRYQLNNWATSVSTPPEWQSPGLLDSIAPSLLTIDFATRMKSLDFGEPECDYLLQCQMLTEVARWVLQTPYRDQLYLEWLQGKQKELTSEQAMQLETTLKLFDWTVCNIGLEGQPKDVERLVTNPDLPISDDSIICRQLPWQTMMFGRGDRWQRARVFTQLLFTQGVDALVLALPSLTGAVENASIRPWCLGIPIGDEIYLFEPQWGLPIPSQRDNGIATLREVKSNPTVLRRAKIPGLFEYPVEPKDLENLIALIDCEPFAVGRAMYTLQKSLTGENRIRISSDASELENRIKKLDDSLSIRLWNVPWLCYVYSGSVRSRLGEQSPFSMQYMEAYGAFITDTPISRARLLYFKGKFESTLDEVGALRTYMDLRIDEQTLKELMVDRATQQEFGIVKGDFESMESYQFRLLQAQNYFRKAKFDVAVFLGMANIYRGKFDTAIDWLQKRTLDLKGTEKWHAHAHYLLGRAYEDSKDVKKAAEEFKYENSPQAAGNRVRLRKLRQMYPTELGEEN